MSEALKVPCIDKYFAYSQIYELYIRFLEMGLPEYQWSDFLTGEVRKIAKLMITQQRFTSA